MFHASGEKSLPNGAASEYAVLVATKHVAWASLRPIPCSKPFYALQICQTSGIQKATQNTFVACRSTMRWPYHLAVGMLHCGLLFNGVLMVQTCLRFLARHNSTALWKRHAQHQLLSHFLAAQHWMYRFYRLGSLSNQRIREMKWSMWVPPCLQQAIKLQRAQA